MVKYRSELLELYCSQLDLTPQQYIVMEVISQRMSMAKGQTPTEVADWLTSPPHFFGGDKQISRKEEAEEAIYALIDRQLVQFLTKESLSEIKLLLQKEGSVGPIGFWPEPGDLDFTWAGAAVWEGLIRILYGVIGHCMAEESYGRKNMVESRIVIGTGLTEVERELSPRLDCEVSNNPSIVHGPTPIGLWRGEWWQLFEFGYVATLTFQDSDIGSRDS